MGNRKSVWIIGGCLLVLIAGLLYTKYAVQENLTAKAADKETINQPINQNGGMNESTAAIQNAKLESNWMEKPHNEAIEYDNRNAENQNAIVKDQKPAAKPVIKASTPKPAQTPAKNPNNANQANSTRKTVYLTFDDGPEIFSKDIITLLEKYHFKATFFMLEPNIKRYPESVKAMVQAGESIGSHGVTHNKNLFYASESTVLGEMDQTRNALRSLTGINTMLIRTPYGSAPYMTPEYKKAVAEHGYLMWDWNIDSRDWYYKDGRYVTSVIDQIAKRGNRSGPIVILLHERRETLIHLPELFDYLAKQGFDCKAIDPHVAPVHF